MQLFLPYSLVAFRGFLPPCALNVRQKIDALTSVVGLVPGRARRTVSPKKAGIKEHLTFIVMSDIMLSKGRCL